MAGFMGRLKDRLSKTRGNLVGNVKKIVTGRSIDDAMFDDLEETLIASDMGVETTLSIVDELRDRVKSDKLKNAEDLYGALKDALRKRLAEGDHTINWTSNNGPHITLIAGVNGSGKTTTTDKLAAKLAGENRKVLLGAADTFRAAAVEQLMIWSDRAKVDIIKHGEGADPASVAFDATDAALARNVDNLLIDTAGRLHTKVNLMEELKKIQRVVQKRHPGAPHEVLLVLDATTGQNGLVQARQFTEALHVTGIILTKLDGTAKGGMAFAIQQQLGISIKYIGVGEGIDDLQPFDPDEFVDALFEEA